MNKNNIAQAVKNVTRKLNFFVFCCVMMIFSCTPDKPSVEQEHSITVGTYNLWCAHSRTKYLSADSEIDLQRYWKPSSSAMAAIIRDLDCDIFAFQEIGDSIYGKKGAETSLKNLMGEEYEWRIWSNVDGTAVTQQSGRLSYSPGICYKKSKFTFLDGGVFWLGGNPMKPEFVRTETFNPEYGDPKRACVWTRMRHIPSGKIFYFLSAHLDTRSFSGVSYPIVNEQNCKNLMEYADRNVVPVGVPSIIAADFNSKTNQSGYATYVADDSNRQHKWLNAYEVAKAEGRLGVTAATSPVTMNEKNEKKLGSSMIDHILVEGFEVLDYDINQKKYRTENGTEHYPSDHFPVVTTLKFK